MNTRLVSISYIARSGWEIVKAHPLEALLGYFVYGALGSIAIFIPLAGPFIVFALIGGLYILYFNLAKGTKADIADLFAGFKDFWKWNGIGWLYIAAMLASALPTAAGITAGVVLLQAAHGNQGAVILGIAAIVTGVLATLVILVILGIRWFFLGYAAADGAGVIESFERSVGMARGMYLQLFLVQLVSWLAGMVGSLTTFGLGVYFVMAIAMGGMARAYLDLRGAPSNGGPDA